MDSTLKAAGEGKCKPSQAECAFLYIGAGSEEDVHQRRRRLLHRCAIDEIRKVKVGAAAATASAKAGGAKAHAASGARRAASCLRSVADVVVVASDATQSSDYRHGTVDRGTAMRRLIIICLLALIAAALLVVPAAAGAQKRSKTPAPQITRVQPMRISVGGTLTIRGRNFKAQRGKNNTVIFRAGDGRTAFAKPRRATRASSWCGCPAAVARLLTVKNSRQRPDAPQAARARRQVQQAHPAAALAGRDRRR